MNQLRRLLRQSDTDSILRLLQSDALHDSAPPPVELLVYAIHAILHPAPEYAQLHHLLRLLTMVEFWRLRALSVVSTALVWQAYYTQVPSPVRLLTHDEELFLRDHEQNSPVWREIFIKIIATCISTHLLRLWLHDSHILFWAHWNEYLKALEDPSFPNRLPHPLQPFHHQLSITDIDQLLDSLQPLANYIQSSFESEDHPPHDQPLPSPTLDDPIRVLITDYLQYVAPLVNEVHNLFPEKLPLPS